MTKHLLMQNNFAYEPTGICNNYIPSIKASIKKKKSRLEAPQEELIKGAGTLSHYTTTGIVPSNMHTQAIHKVFFSGKKQTKQESFR